MGKNFYKSIKKVELDGSEVRVVKGSGKAKDFKKTEVLVYDYDFFSDIGVRRIC